MGLFGKADLKQFSDAKDSEKKREESKLFELGGEKIDLGEPNSFRYILLLHVLDERYDQALAELEKFQKSESVYPNFKVKADRLMSHCLDLIYAVKTKRNFPGLSSLTKPKQQELREKYLSHFRELQWALKRMEKIETDLRLNDAKSTIYVVRALSFSAFAVLVLGFALDFTHGLAVTSLVVMDDYYSRGVNFIFNLCGL